MHVPSTCCKGTIKRMNTMKEATIEEKEENVPPTIKNSFGINPTFYEYLFTVDTDTTVDPMSINQLTFA
jgi:hypothetical protein